MLHHSPPILHHFTPIKPIIAEKYAKKSWDKMSIIFTKVGAKCPWGKMSVGPNVLGAKNPLAMLKLRTD